MHFSKYEWGYEYFEVNNFISISVSISFFFFLKREARAALQGTPRPWHALWCRWDPGRCSTLVKDASGRGRPCGGPAALRRGKAPAVRRGDVAGSRAAGPEAKTAQGSRPSSAPPLPAPEVTSREGGPGWVGQPWTTPEPHPRNEWRCRRRAGSEGRGRT